MALAQSQGVSPLRALAGAAVTQYRAVKVTTTKDRYIHTAAIADVCAGIALVAAAAAGDAFSIQTMGVAKCVAAAAISVGDKVMPDSGGGGKVATSSGAANELGVALTAAAADGDIIEVQLSLPATERVANA